MTTTQNLPTNPERLKSFANFFKGYMSVSSIVTASLPIPITAFKLLPIFQEHLGLLSTYTPIFCFLLLGYIFYARHGIGKSFFPKHYKEPKPPQAYAGTAPDNAVKRYRAIRKRQKLMGISPLICIVIALLFVFLYQLVLTFTLDNILKNSLVNDTAFAQAFGAGTIRPKTLDTQFILEHYQISSSYKGVYLLVCYLGIFLFAELAFILMAIKEFLQDVLGLDEKFLIEGTANQPLSQSNNDGVPV